MHRTKWIAAGVVIVVALGASGYLVREQRQEAAECERLQQVVDRFGTSPVSMGPRVIGVLGDSYSVGLQLDDPRAEAWPLVVGRELDAEVIVSGFPGSGFTQSGYCDGQAFPDRADDLPADADLTVVQGGLNDITNRDDAEDVAARLLAEAPGDVVLVGPPPAPQVQDPEALAEVDQAFAAAADAAGALYVSTLGWDDLDYQPDGLHLTVEGHQTFGERVAAAVLAVNS